MPSDNPQYIVLEDSQYANFLKIFKKNIFLFFIYIKNFCLKNLSGNGLIPQELASVYWQNWLDGGYSPDDSGRFFRWGQIYFIRVWLYLISILIFLVSILKINIIYDLFFYQYFKYYLVLLILFCLFKLNAW